MRYITWCVFLCRDVHEGVRGPLWTADHSIRTVQRSRSSLRTAVAGRAFWSLATGLPWKRLFAQNDSILVWVLCQFLQFISFIGDPLFSSSPLLSEGLQRGINSSISAVYQWILVCAAPKGMVFKRFLLKIGYGFLHFYAWKWVCFVPWSETGCRI